MTPVWNVAPHPHAYPSESPGNWREREIEPFPEGMRPPPFTELDLLMRDWVALIEELRTAASDAPFPERLARVHTLSTAPTRSLAATAALAVYCSI